MPSLKSIKLSSYSSPPSPSPPCHDHEEPTAAPPPPPTPRPPCSPCQHKNHSPPPPGSASSPPPSPMAAAPPPPPPPCQHKNHSSPPPGSAPLPPPPPMAAVPPPPPPNAPLPAPKSRSIAPPPKTPPRAPKAAPPRPSPLPYYPAPIAPSPYFPPSPASQQAIAPFAPPPLGGDGNHHLELGVSLGGLFFLTFLALGLNHIFGKKMFVPGGGGGGDLPPTANDGVRTAATTASSAAAISSEPPASTVTDPPSKDGATEPKKLGQDQDPRNVEQEDEQRDNNNNKKKKKVKADTVVQRLRETTKLLRVLLDASNNPPAQWDRGETSAVNNSDELENGERGNADDGNPDEAANVSHEKDEDNNPDMAAAEDNPDKTVGDDAPTRSLRVPKKPMGGKPGRGHTPTYSARNINLKTAHQIQTTGADLIKESDSKTVAVDEEMDVPEEMEEQEEQAGESDLPELAEDEPTTDDQILRQSAREGEKLAMKTIPPGGPAGLGRGRGRGRGAPSSSARQIKHLNKAGMMADRKFQPVSAQQNFDEKNEEANQITEGDEEVYDDNQDESKDDTAVDNVDGLEMPIIDEQKMVAAAAGSGRGRGRGNSKNKTTRSTLNILNKTQKQVDRKSQSTAEQNDEDTNLQEEERQGTSGNDLNKSSDEPNDEESAPDDDVDDGDDSWLQELGDLDPLGVVENLGAGLFTKWSNVVEKLVERNIQLVYQLHRKINEREKARKHDLNRSSRTQDELHAKGNISDGLKGKAKMAADDEDISGLTNPDVAGEDEFGEAEVASSVPGAGEETIEDEYQAEEGNQNPPPGDEMPRENYEAPLLKGSDVAKNIKAGQQVKATSGALKGNKGRKGTSQVEQAKGEIGGALKKTVDDKDMSRFADRGEGEEDDESRNVQTGNEESGEANTMNDEDGEKEADDISGFTNPEVAGEVQAEDQDPIPDAREIEEEVKTMNDKDQAKEDDKNLPAEEMRSAEETPLVDHKTLVKMRGVAKNIKPGKREGKAISGEVDMGMGRDVFDELEMAIEDDGAAKENKTIPGQQIDQIKGNVRRKSTTQAKQAKGGMGGALVNKAVDYKDMAGFTDPQIGGEGEEADDQVDRETGNEESGDVEIGQGIEEMPRVNYDSLSGVAKNIKAIKQQPKAMSRKEQEMVVGVEGAMGLVEKKTPLSLLKEGKNTRYDEFQRGKGEISGVNVAGVFGDKDTNPQVEDYAGYETLDKGNEEEEMPYESLLEAKNIKAMSGVYQKSLKGSNASKNIKQQPKATASTVFGEQGMAVLKQTEANESFLPEYENVGDDSQVILSSIIPNDGQKKATVAGKHHRNKVRGRTVDTSKRRAAQFEDRIGEELQTDFEATEAEADAAADVDEPNEIDTAAAEDDEQNEEVSQSSVQP